MMQKRTLYSLLLVSFIAVLSFSMAYGQTVTFESKNAARCENGTLNISATNADAVDAVEIVFVITSTAGGADFSQWTVSFDPSLVKLNTRVIDSTSGADHVLPDTIRIAAIKTGSGDELAAGTQVIARLSYKTSDVCSGTIGLGGGTFAYAGGACGFGCGLVAPTIQTQFVKSSDNSLILPTITAGTVTITNVAPTIAAIPNATLPFGSTYTGLAVGSDLDIPRGCETLTYSKVGTLPTNLTVSPGGGISWLTTGADVCTHSVTVAVTDKCGATANTTFTICVTNQAPAFTNCPVAPIYGFAGATITGDLNATDPDLPVPGPYPLLYNLISFSGPGTLTVNPANGMWSWPTLLTPAYTGTFTAVVAVSDSANTCSPCSPANADTCTFTIIMKSEGVVIEKVHDQHQGVYAIVDVSLLPSTFQNYPIAGFDLLIKYDQSALSFIEATPGEFITDCGWEYFTYRTSAFGNCGVGCPTGMVKLVGLAETNNGPNHPDCYVNTGSISEVLAQLKFLVSNDRTLNCQFAPISFYWLDCTDNGLSSVTGDTFMISRYVYKYFGIGGGDSYVESHNPTVGFPTDLGAQTGCYIGLPNKPFPLGVVDFFDGGVDIICSDSIDARGDVNLNNQIADVGDAVMFTRYFLIGTAAFGTHVAGSIAATDVNADGNPLTVADLVLLVRQVVGDAFPIPKTVTNQTVASVKGGFSVSDNGTLSVSVADPDRTVGALYLELKGQANVTGVNADLNTEVAFNSETGNTHVLVMTDFASTNKFEGFTGAVVNIGNAEIVKLEMADDQASPIVAKLVPTHYALSQNYPNPFNPSTTIEFALPTAGNYTLTIYNVNGQVVKTFEGSSEAGIVTETWNADAASGVYFYKLSAGTFSATKKMVLLK